MPPDETIDTAATTGTQETVATAPVADAVTAPAATPAPETPQETAQEITYDLKVADGMPVAEGSVEAFTGVAKELGLSNEQAQRLVDFQTQLAKGQIDAYQAQQVEWVNQMKTDPEIGGEKYAETTAMAVKAFNQFGGVELKEYLESTGLGNFPPLVKAFAAIGKALSDDSFAPGMGVSDQKSAAQRIFPTMTQ